MTGMACEPFFSRNPSFSFCRKVIYTGAAYLLTAVSINRKSDTIFTNSIHVYMISGGVTTELEFGTDYTVPEEFINSCDNDISSAKLMDPAFDADLCRGIKMLRGVSYGTTYTITINYQRLYPNQLRTAYFHNEPLNITPELMLDVVTSIERLNG